MARNLQKILLRPLRPKSLQNLPVSFLKVHPCPHWFPLSAWATPEPMNCIIKQNVFIKKIKLSGSMFHDQETLESRKCKRLCKVPAASVATSAWGTLMLPRGNRQSSHCPSLQSKWKALSYPITHQVPSLPSLCRRLPTPSLPKDMNANLVVSLVISKINTCFYKPVGNQGWVVFTKVILKGKASMADCKISVAT